jgi:muramoyltetrapeptide carboxypeptidase
MITPQHLIKGDTIGLISTARKISAAELDPAIKCLSNEGFKVVTAPNVYGDFHQFAGTDEERIADFEWMMNNPEIKAILCIRGGYGTARIIDHIDFSQFVKTPKWICGYSDVTVLHAHIHKLGIKTIHSTMPINFPTDGSLNNSVLTLIGMLKGEDISYQIYPHPLNRSGNCEGILIGGNLSILYSLQGTDSEIDTQDKILFIEDLDEYLYHIDRMVIALKRGGKIAPIAGLVVGGMSDMHDNNIPFGKTAEQIIHDAVKEFSFPVCFNFPAGHIDENLALIMGSKIKLEVSKKESSITFID